MSDNKPGWYPNPDGTANQRRWDGNSWTNETREYPPPSGVDGKSPHDESAPTEQQTDFFKSIPKSGWVVIAGVVALILLLAAILPAFSKGIQDEQAAAIKSSSHPLTTSHATVAPVKPTPTGPVVVPIGSPIVSPNYSLVIDSVEVLDQIETNYGGPIVADPGTKLVLVHSTISVKGSAIDLTCASAAAIFIQGYDSNKSEMAHVFEGPRIPGNPECNYKTSAGQTVPWNFAFKMGADRTPAIMSVIDTNVGGQWGEAIYASLK